MQRHVGLHGCREGPWLSNTRKRSGLLLSPFEVVAYKIGMNYAEPFLVQGTATIGDAELDQAAADYVSAILD